MLCAFNYLPDKDEKFQCVKLCQSSSFFCGRSQHLHLSLAETFINITLFYLLLIENEIKTKILKFGKRKSFNVVIIYYLLYIGFSI